jgi:Tol biopolymer transport system component
VTLPAGTRLSAYEIVRPIGAGGMGEVYRARDTKLSRDVAIKVLPAAMAADAERLSRFEKEARTASALSHPNIVTIYEIGQADGTWFIAMEIVEGKTLRELLGAGPVSGKKLLSIAAQIADGLAKAHAAGIVHRDLKPENLMVTRDGFVKILDFGLAKLLRTGFEGSHGAEQATVTRGTEAGTVLGTVGYMSPEQASGEPADFGSDQFSFGSILYEMITGKRAFERPTAAQTLSAIIESEPEPLTTGAPRTPTNLVWVVERCLAKDPEDRYGSTKDLARDLAAMRDQSSAISAAGVAPPAARPLRLSRAMLAVAALVVAGIAALAFIAGQRAQARRDREAPPPRRTTLTFRRGFLTGARFAPDGQAIVYSASWDGKPSEIFTTRVGSTESRSLGISPAEILAVSSAGEMAIALDCYSRGPGHCYGTLARVPLAGGAPREILEDVSSADWSPDGKALAVIHVVNRFDRLEYPIGKVLYETNGTLSSARVSPRGDLVAFLDFPRRDSSRGKLCVIDRAGKKKVLTDEWAKFGPILWSPTGEEVFFARWGGREIRGARLSGRTRSAPWIPGLDDVSRDGLFLDTGALVENLRRVILARVPDAKEERNLSWLVASTAADISRDGRQLLFDEARADPDRPDVEPMATFERKTDGSDAKMLGEGRPLALSPDGKWALVRHATEMRFVLLPTGAGEPRSLPVGDFLRLRIASFFPDGQRILFASEDKGGVARSYIQDVEGGSPKPIGEEGLLGMLVSPDGREVAGTTAKGHVIIRSDGEGPPRPIGGARPDDTLLRWSSDGKAIYVRGAEEQPLTLYRLDLATGRRDRWKELAPPDLTGVQGYAKGLGAVCVTPDGRFYAYTVLTDSSRLVLGEAGSDWWK